MNNDKTKERQHKRPPYIGFISACLLFIGYLGSKCCTDEESGFNADKVIPAKEVPCLPPDSLSVDLNSNKDYVQDVLEE